MGKPLTWDELHFECTSDGIRRTRIMWIDPSDIFPVSREKLGFLIESRDLVASKIPVVDEDEPIVVTLFSNASGPISSEKRKG